MKNPNGRRRKLHTSAGGILYHRRTALYNDGRTSKPGNKHQNRNNPRAEKKVSAVTLRLNHSLGGRVGIEKINTLPIKYDEFSEQDVVLYSGDKHITMPNRGFELTGRTVITSDEPYPFNLSAVVREVELDG